MSHIENSADLDSSNQIELVEGVKSPVYTVGASNYPSNVLPEQDDLAKREVNVIRMNVPADKGLIFGIRSAQAFSTIQAIQFDNGRLSIKKDRASSRNNNQMDAIISADTEINKLTRNASINLLVDDFYQCIGNDSIFYYTLNTISAILFLNECIGTEINSVIDLGAGSGILSILARKCNPQIKSAALYDIALKEEYARKHFPNRFNVFLEMVREEIFVRLQTLMLFKNLNHQ
ncbi:MAG: hypothetical protein Q9M91_01560 [Candidatus Dojkabacteria bacterium]|nr:hypothetical protein [Candidatus Dojkabacteria bacterium]